MHTVCFCYYRYEANTTFAACVISTGTVLSKLQVSISTLSFSFATNKNLQAVCEIMWC